MTKDNDLTLEKLNIAARLVDVEKAITTTNELNRKLTLAMYGDPTTDPPIRGINERVKYLEGIEAGRDKAKENMIKMAVGSFTMALGGFIIWVFLTLKDGFLGKGH